jgi:hypothetical protein
MFRIMSIATLVMIAVCFFIGASLAFADEGRGELVPAAGLEQINDASRPVETQFEENLAQNDRGDVYDFSDYVSQPTTTSSVPPVDAEKIEEPNLDRFEEMDA